MFMGFKVLHILVLPCFLSLLLSACAKELAFSEPTHTQLHLTLNYDGCVQMHEATKNTMATGKMRYVIRTFPVGALNEHVDPVHELIVTEDVQNGYNQTVTLDISPGDYQILVWSDLVRDIDGVSCHNVDDFGEIYLLEGSAGNNDYRDAFRGRVSVSVPSGTDEAVSINVDMVRPLARFELVSNDLAEFVGLQTVESDRGFSLEDYTAMIYYVGYMPDTYSLYTDKPVDSATGVIFSSPLREISDTEAAMGFDYVFVGDSGSSVYVRAGVYDKEGRQVSMTAPIKIPLQRNQTTLKRGNFLTSKSSDGINIDQEMDGSFDIVL